MQPTKIKSSELGAVSHPTNERWMEYLYGEMPRSEAAVLRTHLKGCAQCQEQYGGWTRTRERLNGWSIMVPGSGASGADSPRSLKWALAALIVLGIGFGVGRLTSPVPDPDTLRAALEPGLRALLAKEVRQQVQDDIRADWLAAVGTTGEAINNPFRRDLRDGLELWKAQSVAAGTAESRRLAFDLAEQYRSERQEDQQHVLALFSGAEQKHEAEHLRLRRAVETVAVVADDRLQRTANKLGELATYTQAKLTFDSSPDGVEQPLTPVRKKGNQ